MDEQEMTMEETQDQQEEQLAEMTDEQAQEILYGEEAEAEEEVNALEDEEQQEEEESAEEETAEEKEPEHRARDEPSADEAFAQRVRKAYAGMTDEQIMDAMITSRAEKMHEEDPEISVKAAKMIIMAREGLSDTGKKQESEQDDHAKMLREQAQEMAGTREGAQLLKEMLEDETVKRKINAGEWDVKQARAYYEGKQETESAQRKAPVTMKMKPAQTARRKSMSEMSDEEFDRVEQRVENALRAGKHVKF